MSNRASYARRPSCRICGAKLNRVAKSEPPRYASCRRHKPPERETELGTERQCEGCWNWWDLEQFKDPYSRNKNPYSRNCRACTLERKNEKARRKRVNTLENKTSEVRKHAAKLLVGDDTIKVRLDKGVNGGTSSIAISTGKLCQSVYVSDLAEFENMCGLKLIINLQSPTDRLNDANPILELEEM